MLLLSSESYCERDLCLLSVAIELKSWSVEICENEFMFPKLENPGVLETWIISSLMLGQKINPPRIPRRNGSSYQMLIWRIRALYESPDCRHVAEWRLCSGLPLPTLTSVSKNTMNILTVSRLSQKQQHNKKAIKTIQSVLKRRQYLVHFWIELLKNICGSLSFGHFHIV